VLIKPLAAQRDLFERETPIPVVEIAKGDCIPARSVAGKKIAV
jgi:hypothetical protein